MIPSFLYQGVHNDHHNMNLYGTKDDGEYLPFIHEGRLKIILFVEIKKTIKVILFVKIS